MEGAAGRARKGRGQVQRTVRSLRKTERSRGGWRYRAGQSPKAGPVQTYRTVARSRRSREGRVAASAPSTSRRGGRVGLLQGGRHKAGRAEGRGGRGRSSPIGANLAQAERQGTREALVPAPDPGQRERSPARCGPSAMRGRKGVTTARQARSDPKMRTSRSSRRIEPSPTRWPSAPLPRQPADSRCSSGQRAEPPAVSRRSTRRSARRSQKSPPRSSSARWSPL